jgi:hypothetical protein
LHDFGNVYRVFPSVFKYWNAWAHIAGVLTGTCGASATGRDVIAFNNLKFVSFVQQAQLGRHTKILFFLYSSSATLRFLLGFGSLALANWHATMVFCSTLWVTSS